MSKLYKRLHIYFDPSNMPACVKSMCKTWKHNVKPWLIRSKMKKYLACIPLKQNLTMKYNPVFACVVKDSQSKTKSKIYTYWMNPVEFNTVFGRVVKYSQSKTKSKTYIYIEPCWVQIWFKTWTNHLRD